MPGFNQRGPMNEGPMTGRGRGDCRGTDPVQGFEGRPDTMGMGRQGGRRGCQAPGRGRGAGLWAGSAPVTTTVNQNALQNSVDKLEAELAAVKQQLKNLSESGE